MRDLSDAEIARLQTLLDERAAAPQAGAPRAATGGDAGDRLALDVSALDGYLCGVLLQPQALAEAAWLPPVLGGAGAAGRRSAADLAPSAQATAELQALVRRRHGFVAAAIAERRWFDPWIFELGDGGAAQAAAGAEQASALPWVAGFALAMESFPELLRLDAARLAEPLALLYQHFDESDLEGLEDEPALAAALEALEPPADLAQTAEDLVRAVLMLADVSRPAAGRVPPRPAQVPRQRAPGHASPGPAPRSQSGHRARARRG